LKPGIRTRARLLPAYVEVWQERECLARHERSFGRHEQVLDLEHYLDVLERKQGALAGSSPLQQWRERGRWPESFDRLWNRLSPKALQRRRSAPPKFIESTYTPAHAPRLLTGIPKRIFWLPLSNYRAKPNSFLVAVQGKQLCSELCSIRANSAALGPCGPALCA